jgi:hypothetical protein
MKLLLTAIIVAVLSFTARAQSPVIKAHIEPAKNILVGQPVCLIVTVYVPNYFTGSPDFPEFEIENAIVVLPQDRPENSNTEINGVRYAGITETYVIYPQQAGDFQLPPATLTVPYTVAPPKSITATAHLPALTFHADVPAAARDLDYFLPTTNLTIQQQWSVLLKNLRVGDSIQRTITVTATKMQAMLIPPLLMDAPDGIRVYPEEPVVQDQKTPRGDFVFGRRVQSAKYFIQREGEYTLPQVELKWWNLSTSRLVTATLPEVHFTAAPNPGYVAELPPEAEPAVAAPVRHVSWWRRYRHRVLVAAPLCFAAIFLGWMVWHLFPKIVRDVRRWREERRQSESAYFRNLRRACDRNDAAQSYAWLLKWSSVAYPGMSLQQVSMSASDSALTTEIDGLGAALFATEKGERWDGRHLARLLKELRGKHRKEGIGDRKLRELNPV